MKLSDTSVHLTLNTTTILKFTIITCTCTNETDYRKQTYDNGWAKRGKTFAQQLSHVHDALYTKMTATFSIHN